MVGHAPYSAIFDQCCDIDRDMVDLRCERHAVGIVPASLDGMDHNYVVRCSVIGGVAARHEMWVDGSGEDRHDPGRP